MLLNCCFLLILVLNCLVLGVLALYFATRGLISPSQFRGYINYLSIHPSFGFEWKNREHNFLYWRFVRCSKFSCSSGISPIFCRNTARRFTPSSNKLMPLPVMAPVMVAMLAPSTTNPSLPLTGSGCVSIPSWVSCVLIRGHQSEKARDRRCSQPSMRMVRCWRASRGIQYSGR